MVHPLINQLPPLIKILRRIGLPTRNRRRFVRIERCRIKIRPNRKVLRHEPNLRIRLQPALHIRVENPIENGPVINRIPPSILRIRIRRAPLQRRNPVAGSQKMMAANINLRRLKLRKLRQKLLTARHEREVRLVIPEESPDRFPRAKRSRSVDVNGNRQIGRRGRRIGANDAANHHKQQRNGSPFGHIGWSMEMITAIAVSGAMGVGCPHFFRIDDLDKIRRQGEFPIFPPHAPRHPAANEKVRPFAHGDTQQKARERHQRLRRRHPRRLRGNVLQRDMNSSSDQLVLDRK